jgi:FkbM family methyltransferase
MIWARRLVPAPLREARRDWLRYGHPYWHWLRGSEIYAAAPLTSLARLIRWVIMNSTRREIAFATRDGLRFVSAPKNFTSFVLYLSGRRDPAIDRFIRGRIGAGAVFVDAGANIGAYTVPASRQVGPNGRVVAFEAHPVTYAYLARNIVLNTLGNVVGLNNALGSKPGWVEMDYQRSNPGETHVAADSTPTGTRVELVTLDDTMTRLGIARIEYLKIDVEGYELQVLRGARGIIDRSCGIVVQTELIEQHLRRYGTTVADVVAFLRELGFTPHMVHRDGSAKVVAQGMALPDDAIWLRV